MNDFRPRQQGKSYEQAGNILKYCRNNPNQKITICGLSDSSVEKLLGEVEYLIKLLDATLPEANLISKFKIDWIERSVMFSEVSNGNA